jgi:hypothetical protein
MRGEGQNRLVRKNCQKLTAKSGFSFARKDFPICCNKRADQLSFPGKSMKTKLKQLVIFGFAFAVIFQLHAQGTFVNLNFESAVVAALPSSPAFMTVPVTNALPSWNVYFGSSLQPLMSYNTKTLGSVGVSLWGPGSIFPGFGGLILQGQYTVLLQGGVNPFSADKDATIAQNGTIPATARSLLALISGQSLRVTFAGQELAYQDLSVVQTPEGYTVRTIGIDVTSLAGQPGELRFTAPYILDVPNELFLDSIRFSNQPIPEPSPFALIMLGVSSLFLFRRKRNSLTSGSTR